MGSKKTSIGKVLLWLLVIGLATGLLSAKLYLEYSDDYIGSGFSFAKVSDITDSVGYLEIFDEDENLLWCGSAWVCGKDLVATCYHCISANTLYNTVNSGTITFYYGTKDEDVRDIQGVLDYDMLNDISVLRVDTSGIKPIKLGDSDKVRASTDISIVSIPLGNAHNASYWSKSTIGKVGITEFLSDVSTPLLQYSGGEGVQSGSSGGVVLKGTLAIGVVSAAYNDTGIDIAAPINFLKELIKGIEKDAVGETLQELNENSKYYFESEYGYRAMGERYTSVAGEHIEKIRYSDLTDENGSEQWLYSSFTINDDYSRSPDSPFVRYISSRRYEVCESLNSGYKIDYDKQDDVAWYTFRHVDSGDGYEGNATEQGVNVYRRVNNNWSGPSVYANSDGTDVRFSTREDTDRQGIASCVFGGCLYLESYIDDKENGIEHRITLKTGEVEKTNYVNGERQGDWLASSFVEAGISYEGGSIVKIYHEESGLTLEWESDDKFTMQDDDRYATVDGDNVTISLKSANKPYIQAKLGNNISKDCVEFEAAATDCTGYAYISSGSIGIQNNKTNRQAYKWLASWVVGESDYSRGAYYYPSEAALRIFDYDVGNYTWLGKHFAPIIISIHQAKEEIL